MTPWIHRLGRFRLSDTERIVAGTSLAGVIVFAGLLADIPTVKRAKTLEAEHHTLGVQISSLTERIDQLAIQQRQITDEAATLQSAPPDPRVSTFIADLSKIDTLTDVHFGAIRPVHSQGTGTAVAIEIDAPLQILGPYLDRLEASPWSIRIRDLTVTRKADQWPSVTARFTAETPVMVHGLEPGPSPG